VQEEAIASAKRMQHASNQHADSRIDVGTFAIVSPSARLLGQRMGVKLHLMSAVAIKIGNSTIVTEVDDTVAAIKVLPCKPNLKIESSMWIESGQVTKAAWR
jgi:hypothetical protein